MPIIAAAPQGQFVGLAQINVALSLAPWRGAEKPPWNYR